MAEQAPKSEAPQTNHTPKKVASVNTMPEYSKTRATRGRVLLCFRKGGWGAGQGTQEPRPGIVVNVFGDAVFANIHVLLDAANDGMAIEQAKAAPGINVLMGGTTMASVPVYDPLTPEERDFLSDRQPYWAEWMPFQKGQAQKNDNDVAALRQRLDTLELNLTVPTPDRGNIAGRLDWHENRLDEEHAMRLRLNEYTTKNVDQLRSYNKLLEDRLSHIEAHLKGSGNFECCHHEVRAEVEGPERIAVDQVHEVRPSQVMRKAGVTNAVKVRVLRETPSGWQVEMTTDKTGTIEFGVLCGKNLKPRDERLNFMMLMHACVEELVVAADSGTAAALAEAGVKDGDKIEPRQTLVYTADGPKIPAPGPRQLTSHKVNGCNEQITIEVMDTPGAGGMCQAYRVKVGPWKPEGQQHTFGPMYTQIQFQNGPIKESGVNGITNEVLLAILEDRIAGAQRGQYACAHNDLVHELMTKALSVLKLRTKGRTAAGVEGTHAKGPESQGGVKVGQLVKVPETGTVFFIRDHETCRCETCGAVWRLLFPGILNPQDQGGWTLLSKEAGSACCDNHPMPEMPIDWTVTPVTKAA